LEKLKIGDVKMDFIREELNEECGIKIMNLNYSLLHSESS
jgi:hypothetical protein